MITRASLILITAFLLFAVTNCITTKPVITGDPSGQTPSAEREFRAAWVATVANINWPSKPGIPVNEQKKEATKLLDLLHDHNFNAVIFQVRPQCDALYKSNFEPWSYYLTGKQGKAPDPYYDPLEFWIVEAHKRGLELHAWLNPYRAHHNTGGEISEKSVVNIHPDLVVRLENGHWWMDPSRQGTQDHSYNVVMDLVRRYDLDGIHFDDYFYPYPSYNNNKDFPDDESWAAYQQGGGNLSRGDWRRESVNSFIKRTYEGIKAEKLHVKFGLSPFGIWRPYNPPAIAGFDQHNVLFADARLWLNEGWIDYWTPQLYWPINQLPQSYPLLLGWWDKENKKGRHIWPGMSVGRYRGDQGIDETINQIMVTRGMLSESPGEVHWSIGPLVSSPNLVKAIAEGPYKRQALIPPSPWLDDKAPTAPEVKISLNKDTLTVSWGHEDLNDIARWVVYYKHGPSWNQTIHGNNIRSDNIPGFVINQSYLDNTNPQTIKNIEDVIIPLDRIAVSAVDRFGNESTVTQMTVSTLSTTDAPPLEEILKGHALKEKEPVLKPPVVKPGIDVLVEDHLDLIKNKKVGLITNPSAVSADLRSSIDILAGTPGVNLVALFGAEHGVRGAKQGRIIQEGELDPQTGIPVYSMYGDSYAPKKEWIKDLDALIFDIQGVGSAWYTFKYSMSFAMEACAQAGIPFIVLDRPNPLGGRVVEGPNLDIGRIFRHPLPFRHGMTYGELASMWNDTEGFGADLTVIKMKGWRRSMTWDDTGLFWIMPSPNMGTLETAIVYPGQCLFERMNISEARGTTKPFLMTGAPWVDAVKAAKDLNSRGIDGAVFRPVYFIPKNATPGSNPRGKPWNKMSGGVEIMLTDYDAFKSVEAAVHIIDAYQKTNPDSLVWSPPPIIKQLDEPGMTVEQVIEDCQKEIGEFLEIRRKYLLYR
ncbi:exo-beta-N-acetylmuramidase NamZ domain-containing protein [Bacteroidota bacterium]